MRREWKAGRLSLSDVLQIGIEFRVRNLLPNSPGDWGFYFGLDFEKVEYCGFPESELPKLLDAYLAGYAWFEADIPEGV